MCRIHDDGNCDYFSPEDVNGMAEYLESACEWLVFTSEDEAVQYLRTCGYIITLKDEDPLQDEINRLKSLISNLAESALDYDEINELRSV